MGDLEFGKSRTPRGVIHSDADGKIEDIGALTAERMKTIDDETTAAAQAFIERQAKSDQPFFVWMNATRMHLFTHVHESMKGRGRLRFLSRGSNRPKLPFESGRFRPIPAGQQRQNSAKNSS